MLDNADSSVRFDADRCVSLASPVVACGACATACPTAAIAVDANVFTLHDDACVGCGRCAAVCPTEALIVTKPSQNADTALAYECSRVPPAPRLAGTTVVPCLGGLTAADLLASSVAEGVTLVDRGWCAACPAGGTAAPWAAALADAGRITAMLGFAAPEVAKRPLPDRLARPLERHLGAKGASRRALFRRVIEPSGRAAPPIRRPAMPARKVEPAATVRRAEAIHRLAEAANEPVPAKLFPAFHVSDACQDSRICTALCPTEALVRVEEPAATQIDFRAARCIDCGACVERCPAGAIERVAADAPYRETQTLKRSAERTCTACERRFVPKLGETVCKSCTDDRELAMAGFALQRRGAAGRCAPTNDPDRGGA